MLPASANRCAVVILPSGNCSRRFPAGAFIFSHFRAYQSINDLYLVWIEGYTMILVSRINIVGYHIVVLSFQRHSENTSVLIVITLLDVISHSISCLLCHNCII